MDKLIEEKFVKNFIIKEKRDRTLYELCSTKKRDQIIHQLTNLFDEKYVILNNCKISDRELLNHVEKIFNIKSNCYVIADSADDGKILPFKLAFDNMMNNCVDYILICDENIVVVKEEVIIGSPTKKILYKH